MSHINSPQFLGRAVMYQAKPNDCFIHGMNLLCLRADRQKIDPAYAAAYFQTQTFKRQVNKIAKKSVNQASFSTTALKDLTIPICNLRNQGEIANRFASISALMDDCERQLSTLDDLVKSEFVEMFEGVDKVVELGEVCKFVSGKSLPKEIELPNGDCLYAKVGDLNLDGNERLITRSRTYVSFESAKGSLIPSGAVVFPKRGGAIGTNKKRITALNCCLDLNLMAVIPSSLVATEYLYWFFRLIDLNKIANGSTVPQINNKDLRPLRFPLPPLALQQQFADFVAEVDKLRFDCCREIVCCGVLFSSMSASLLCT